MAEKIVAQNESLLGALGQLMSTIGGQAIPAAGNAALQSSPLGSMASMALPLLEKLISQPKASNVMQQKLQDINLGLMNESQVADWTKVQNRIAMEEGEKALRKGMSEKITSGMQVDPQGTSEAISKAIASQEAEDAMAEQGPSGTTPMSSAPAQAIPVAQAVPGNSGTPDMNAMMNSPMFKLGALLSMAGTGLRGGNPMETLSGMAALSKNQQQMEGNMPLQVGEAQKMAIEHGYKMSEIKAQNEDELFKNLITTGNKAMPAETVKLVSNIDSGMQQLSALAQAYQKNPDIFKTTNLSATGQQVNLMLEDISDILGRLRSGGAINKEEEARFMNQLPKKGFLSGRIEKPQTVTMKLNKMQSLFQEIKAKAEPNVGIANGVNAALQAGATQEQIMRIMKKRGGK